MGRSWIRLKYLAGEALCFRMVYTRLVEIGRVAYVAFGPDEGKLCVIVDVIDQNRALIDGPCSGVARKAISFKQLHLTEHVIKIAHREKRSMINDFERFKLMKAKQSRNRLITVE